MSVVGGPYLQYSMPAYLYNFGKEVTTIDLYTVPVNTGMPLDGSASVKY